MVRILEWFPSGAFYILALAAQVSGYTSPIVALLLAAFGTLMLLIPACYHARHWHKRRIEGGRRSVEPTHLLVIGLVGIVVFAVISLGAVIWQYSISSRSTESETITVTVQTTPSTPTKDANKLIGNIGPDIPETIAARMARIIQLKELITEANRAKQEIDNMGEMLKKGIINPAAAGYAERSGWPSALERLKHVNTMGYKNRILDLQAVDPTYIGFPAPGEDSIRGDIEKVRTYRIAHWLKVSIMKQADALIRDMEIELSAIEKTIKESPPEKFHAVK